MEEKSILRNHPARVLGLQVTPTQQICFCFLLPTVFNCLVYIIDFASSIAVLQQHFKEGNAIWGVLTLLIMYIPAVVFFILIVSKPDLWDEQCADSRATLWFFTRLINILVFPIWGMYRYSKQLFWSLEALLSKGQLREDALQRVSLPSRIELYLFLQPFLQGAPQAMLQLYVLFVQHNDHVDTGPMQVLCIASSLMIVTIAIVTFQRFESQKVLGRREPWKVSPSIYNTTEKKPREKVNNELSKEGNTVEYIKEGIDSEFQHVTQQTHDNCNNNDEGSETPFLQPRGPQSLLQNLDYSQEDGFPEKMSDIQPPEVVNILQGSNKQTDMNDQRQTQSCNYSAPTPSNLDNIPHSLKENTGDIWENTSRSPPPTPPKPSDILGRMQDQIGNDYSSKMSPPNYSPPTPPKPTNILEIMKDQIHNENNSKMSPPSYSPPTPPKPTNILEIMKDQIQNENRSQMSPPSYFLPTPPKPANRLEGSTAMSDQGRLHSTEELKLPSRRLKVKGLQQDDLMGKTVAFLGWFFFLVSRMLAIAACAYFLPWLALATCALHYVVTVGYLLSQRRCPSIYKVSIQLYLGYIFLFCLIEYQLKFTRVIVTHIIYFVTVALQNVIISTAWYKFSEWDGWWYNYAYFLILGTLITSFTSIGMYFYMMKPTSQMVYEDEIQTTS